MADEQFDVLPRPYALALRLRAIGADERLIGDCLELETSAVAALLALADAKLRSAIELRERAVADGTADPLGARPSYHPDM